MNGCWYEIMNVDMDWNSWCFECSSYYYLLMFCSKYIYLSIIFLYCWCWGRPFAISRILQCTIMIKHQVQFNQQLIKAGMLHIPLSFICLYVIFFTDAHEFFRSFVLRYWNYLDFDSKRKRKKKERSNTTIYANVHMLHYLSFLTVLIPALILLYYRCCTGSCTSANLYLTDTCY